MTLTKVVSVALLCFFLSAPRLSALGSGQLSGQLLRSSCVKVSASYVISVSKNITILRDNIIRANISLVLFCLQKTEGQANVLDSFAIITRKIPLY